MTRQTLSIYFATAFLIATFSPTFATKADEPQAANFGGGQVEGTMRDGPDLRDPQPDPEKIKQDRKEAREQLEALLDVPKGKDLAFYEERGKAIGEAYSKYTRTAPDAYESKAISKRASRAHVWCMTYEAFSDGFDRNASPMAESTYRVALRNMGKVEELQDLLEKEKDKKEPDAQLVETLNRYIADAKIAKLVNEGKIDDIRAQFDDSIEALKENVKDVNYERLVSPEERQKYLSDVGPVLSVIDFLKQLGQDELADELESKAIDAFYDSKNKIFMGLAENFGAGRFLELLGNTLKLEGLYQDGAEFSFDEYLGKELLIYLPGPAVANSRFEDDSVVRFAYQIFHDAGFEVVEYLPKQFEETFAAHAEKFEIPWKVVSETKTKESKDKKYVDFQRYYGLRAYPTLILVGKDGKVVRTHVRAAGLLGYLCSVYPEKVDVMLEKFFDTPGDESDQFYRDKRNVVSAVRFAAAENKKFESQEEQKEYNDKMYEINFTISRELQKRNAF